MKKHFGIVLTVIFLIATIMAVVLLNSTSAVRAGALAPTPAPTRTLGPPPPIQEFSAPSLAYPIGKQDAVQIAYEFDKQNAVWDLPWSPEELNQQGGRITVQWYADRNSNGAQYGPGTERGPVWLITIKGRVRMIKSRDSRTHDSVTYIIAQKTGHFLGWRD